MSHVFLESSTEDEGVDEEMMFEFEQELDARLSLQSDASATSAIDRCTQETPRPRNPVAAILQNAGEIETKTFTSLSSSPFCAYGDEAVARMALHIGSGKPEATASAARASSPFLEMPKRPLDPMPSRLRHTDENEEVLFTSLSTSPFSSLDSSFMGATSLSAPAELLEVEKSPSFDFNGRRKRKYFDDSCCVTPRVRPLAKRAKSFSCVSDAVMPSAVSTSASSTPHVSPSNTKPLPSLTNTKGVVAGLKRSESIQIPRRALRQTSQYAQRSSSGPTHGGSKTVDVPAASSDPLISRTSSSWNASVEYFCRRSLDISSPLRLRFRDLVVGSVGRAGSLQSP